MTEKLPDFFEQAGGFLDAFGKVLESGFFSSMNVEMNAIGPAFRTISVRATGYIPTDVANREAGMMPFWNPQATIDALRQQVTADGFRFKYRTCEVKTEDWPEWDQHGENVIGSFGTQYQFTLTVNLENPDEVTD